MKIKNSKTGKHLNIYSARLTFARERSGKVRNKVYITLNYYGKKEPKKVNLPIPKEIDLSELNWIRERDIAVYYRERGQSQLKKKGDYHYSSGNIRIPTQLSQKLEELVKEACFENFE